MTALYDRIQEVAEQYPESRSAVLPALRLAQDGDDLLRVMHERVRAVPGVIEVDSFVGLRIAKGTFRYTDLGRAGEPTVRCSERRRRPASAVWFMRLDP